MIIKRLHVDTKTVHEFNDRAMGSYTCEASINDVGELLVILSETLPSTTSPGEYTTTGDAISLRFNCGETQQIRSALIKGGI